METERDVERALRRAVTQAGGLCLKFVSPGWDGAPDRLCLFFPGKAAFVELKRPGKKPRLLQERRMEQLREKGFTVLVVDRKEQIPEVIEQMVGGGALAET